LVEGIPGCVEQAIVEASLISRKGNPFHNAGFGRQLQYGPSIVQLILGPVFHDQEGQKEEGKRSQSPAEKPSQQYWA